MSQRCDGKIVENLLNLAERFLHHSNPLSKFERSEVTMAADIISTIGDLIKWIIDTVKKFKKK